jgi:hypothetical protein
MLSQSLSHGGSYKKSHTFDYKHGTAIERDPSASRSTSRQGNNIKVLPPRAAHVIRGYSNYGNFLRDEQEEPGMQQRSTSSLRQNSTDSWEGAGRESSLSMVSDYTLSYGVEALEPQQLVQNNDGRFVPAYVALDRKVLRFHAWFRDSRGAVGFKVRKATLFHYLEDGSTRVSEKRVENSGIVTGEIARRHRVPKKEGGYYTVEDFDVGTHIEIFGRAYHITDVDDFTREFYELNGMPRSEAIGMPSDYLEPASRSLPATIHSYPDVMFQNQGVSDRFLNLDRKVLRFYCSWKDDKPYGEETFYVLNYFLVDDTAEVIEIHERNDGRDHWQSYLKRRPLLKGLPRQVIETEEDRKKNPQPRWHWTELRVGEIISVLNRDFLVMDCDAFTRDWMLKHNLDQPQALRPDPPAVVEYKRRIPVHDGLGSAEDSFQTVLNPIMPKVCKKDFIKALANGAKVMRFKCSMYTTVPEDEGRVFIISFFLADDTISIYERPTRNTFAGLRADGCKFLEKSLVRHPDGSSGPLPRYYGIEDVRKWQKGSEIRINGHVFKVLETDDFTSTLQTGEPLQLDPHRALILSQIQQQMKKVAIKLSDQFSYCDRKDDGVISADELDITLKTLGIRISESEVHDIIAHYDVDADGGLDMEEFSRMIGALDQTANTSVRSPGKMERCASTSAGQSFNRGDPKLMTIVNNVTKA